MHSVTLPAVLRSETGTRRLALIGHSFFAAALVAWGIQHIVYRDFVTRVTIPWPQGTSGREFPAIAFGLLLIVAGVAIFMQKKTRLVALALAGMFFVSFVALHLPHAMASDNWGVNWTSAFKAATLCANAIAVALTVDLAQGNPSTRLPRRSDAALWFFGRLCFGSFLVLCGIQHFMWTKYVAPLVPGWIPGPYFWTEFAGAALIAGGVGLVLPWTARLAAACVALMIFLWVWLIHIELVIGNPRSSNELTAFFEALSFSGAALLYALPYSKTSYATASPMVAAASEASHAS